MQNAYGHKLTEEEYKHQIFEALKRYDTTKRSEMAKFNEEELNINIDHRLGVNYPADKRALIHNLRKISHIQIIKLVAAHKLSSFLPEQMHVHIMNKVIENMLGKAKSFMSKQEIKDMFFD